MPTKPPADTVTTTTKRTTTKRAARSSSSSSDDSGLPADVEAAFSELGADASNVALWRLEEGGDAYLGKVRAADFSLDWVLNTHGGGKYRARAQNAANQWIKTATFTIAGKPKAPTPAGADAIGTGNPNGKGGGLPPWLQQVLVASVPVVVGAIAKSMLEGKKTDPLLELLVKRASGSENMSPVELIKLLDNARRDARDETREAIAAAAAAGGDRTGGGSTWADVVRDTFPALIDTFRREQDDRQTPRRAIAATSTPPGAEGMPTSSSSSANSPAWMAKVRPYLGTLLRWADTNKTPEVKAEGVVDDLGQADAEDLGAHSASPTFIADVFAYFPELQATPARREWFIKFLLHVQACFTAEEESGAGAAAPASSPGMPSAAATSGAPAV